jgi:hypothetical protein
VARRGLPPPAHGGGHKEPLKERSALTPGHIPGAPPGFRPVESYGGARISQPSPTTPGGSSSSYQRGAPSPHHHSGPSPHHHSGPSPHHQSGPSPHHHSAPSPHHHPSGPSPHHHSAPSPHHHSAPSPHHHPSGPASHHNGPSSLHRGPSPHHRGPSPHHRGPSPHASYAPSPLHHPHLHPQARQGAASPHHPHSLHSPPDRYGGGYTKAGFAPPGAKPPTNGYHESSALSPLPGGHQPPPPRGPAGSPLPPGGYGQKLSAAGPTSSSALVSPLGQRGPPPAHGQAVAARAAADGHWLPGRQHAAAASPGLLSPRDAVPMNNAAGAPYMVMMNGGEHYPLDLGR